MFQFCFNDCIPKDGSDDKLVKFLATNLKHYNSIKNNFPGFVDGILTDRLPEKVILNNNNFTLKNCIKHLDRELLKIAYRDFGKYPLEEYYNQFDIDSLLENEYTITVNKALYDATNAKIVQENDGILFTLPVHDDLKKDSLAISDRAKAICEVVNQFGEESNSTFISEYIQADKVKRATGFDKLLALVGLCKFNQKFRSDFERLTSKTQEFLLKEVKHAIKRNLTTRFYPDDNLIKDVTPDKEKQISILELRIYSPVAIRMYFYESSTKIYFGSINGKPKKKVQDNDILNAASIIHELIMLDNLGAG